MSWEPLETLVRELKSTDYFGSYIGSLGTAHTELGITTSNISVQPLSRTKNPSMTYKLTETLGKGRTNSWVVKFSPADKQYDPWYDVWSEYQILKAHHTGSPGEPEFPSPKPLYCCSEAERKVVCTKFIFMEFVKGETFENASSIPVKNRQKAFTSVMRTLAGNVHYYRWVYEDSQFHPKHTDSSTFWATQVASWKRNYGDISLRASDSGFFDIMCAAKKPSHSETKIIHGDMNISNVIFDDEYNVKAIVDWKSFDNGDPMVDVAYLCLTFMTPGDYGHQFRALNKHPLLLAHAHKMEARVLEVYIDNCNFVFRQEVFDFAKAVCCLRWLSILQAARADNFVGHESGDYEDNTDSTQLVMDCLATAGKSFYTRSTS